MSAFLGACAQNGRMFRPTLTDSGLQALRFTEQQQGKSAEYKDLQTYAPSLHTASADWCRELSSVEERPLHTR